MLKRFASLGVALICTLSFSVPAAAASTTSTVHMGFPYFSNLWLRGAGGTNGTTVLVDGSNGSRPISSWFGTVDQNLQNTSIIASFRIGGTYNLGVVSDQSQTISYKVPYIISVENSRTYSGHYDTVDFLVGYNSTGEKITKIEANRSRDDISLSGSGYDYYNYGDKSYTATISGGESLILKNDIISAGDYCVTGYMEFDDNDFDRVEDFFKDQVIVVIYDGTEFLNADILNFSLQKSTVFGSPRKVIEFVVAFNIPVDFNNSYNNQRVQLEFQTYNIPVHLYRFGISSNAFAYQDTVTGIAGLSAQLGNWFSGIKTGISSGFVKIQNLLMQRDNDASSAASSANSSGVSSASSTIAEIESFEAGLNADINTNVAQIDFALPTGSGFTGALGAVSYIFGEVFGALGIYQYMLTIPLILGVMLLLLGRGQAALGRILARRGSEDS